MLREKPGAGLHDLGPAQPIGLDGHARADRIAIARRSRARRMASDAARRREIVPEHAQLRRLPRRHHHEIRIAVTIDIEHGERSAVLIEVEPHRARDLVEAAVAVVAQEHVALVAGDRPVNQQLVDRPPRIVVRRARDARERRARHDLPPEEAFEIVAAAASVSRVSMPLTM